MGLIGFGESLVALLRETLDTLQEPEITLQREVEIVSKYLTIELMRFGDRLSPNLEISSETLQAMVPTFMLQPIVENCIRHGIEPQASPGEIRITSELVEQRVIIRVEDTGVGLSQPRKRKPVSGLGLMNTRDRLERLYPGDHELMITPQEPKGFLVTIEIPFHTKATKA